MSLRLMDSFAHRSLTDFQARYTFAPGSSTLLQFKDPGRYGPNSFSIGSTSVKVAWASDNLNAANLIACRIGLDVYYDKPTSGHRPIAIPGGIYAQLHINVTSGRFYFNIFSDTDQFLWQTKEYDEQRWYRFELYYQAATAPGAGNGVIIWAVEGSEEKRLLDVEAPSSPWTNVEFEQHSAGGGKVRFSNLTISDTSTGYSIAKGMQVVQALNPVGTHPSRRGLQPTVSTKKKLWLFLGQSNADGLGTQESNLPAALRGPQANLKIWNWMTGGAWETLNPGVNTASAAPLFPWYGPEVSFMDAARSYYPGEDLYCYKLAKSSTSLTRWDTSVTGWNHNFRFLPTSMYNQLVATLASALISLGTPAQVQVMGIVWMQGENDAALEPTFGSLPAYQYDVELSELVANIQSDLTTAGGYNTDFKFIYTLLHGWLNTTTVFPGGFPNLRIVQQRQRYALAQNPSWRLVSTGDALLQLDRAHFTDNYHVSLGVKLFEQWRLAQEQHTQIDDLADAGYDDDATYLQADADDALESQFVYESVPNIRGPVEAALFRHWVRLLDAGSASIQVQASNKTTEQGHLAFNSPYTLQTFDEKALLVESRSSPVRGLSPEYFDDHHFGVTVT